MKFTRFSFLLLCFVATSFAGAAQSNIYMRVLDPSQINGESVAAGFQNWTEITAFNAGATQPSNFTQGSGKADSKCFTISMSQDKMAYYLKRKLFLGATLTSIQLDFTRPSNTSPTAFIYYMVQMENVYVTAIEEAQIQGNPLITMNVSFLPARFRYTFFTQNSNGTTGPTTIFGWDVTANAPW